LAKEAERVARSRNTIVWCYKGVKQAIWNVMEIKLNGRFAFEAAELLEANQRFVEIFVINSQLPLLPAGAIVVWAKTAKSENGHMSIALGDGREASDHIENQKTSLRGEYGFRVFVPIE